MKKVILYLLTMIFALSTATALAAEPADAPVSMRERMEKIRVESDPVYQAEKAKRMENMPKVAVLYVNNAETTYNDEVDGVVLGNLEKCINDDKYIYINGEPYIEKLNKVGIVDITTAERADIVDAFEGEDVDYVVFIEVQPFIARDKVTFFTVGKDITLDGGIPFDPGGHHAEDALSVDAFIPHLDGHLAGIVGYRADKLLSGPHMKSTFM